MFLVLSWLLIFMKVKMWRTDNCNIQDNERLVDDKGNK